MIPDEWNKVFHRDAPLRAARIVLAREVRKHLVTLGVEDTITTNQLVEALYPRAVADQTLAGDNARTEMYRQLTYLANNELEDCCMKGEITGQYMGKPKRPKIWFAPLETEICCMCGQVVV